MLNMRPILTNDEINCAEIELEPVGQMDGRHARRRDRVRLW